MLKKIGLFLVLYSVCMFLSLNMNSKYKIYTYKSTMFADASGYFVYLPATILYNWQLDKMPAKMDSLTGWGFSYQYAQNKIFTKYTCGIAYLQLPFFMAVHGYCKITNQNANGFSQAYVNGMLFSGVFYMLLGLFFLYHVLRHYFSKKISVLVCFALLICSNLYFYGIEHNGLSHVYSFSLISAAIYFMLKNKPYIWFVLLPIFSLLVLIRPTNVVVILLLLTYFWGIHKKNMFTYFNFKSLVIGGLIGIGILLPQLFYWHSVSGNWLMYSYKGEGFIHWKNPKILEVLFAPMNGFFPYAPIFILALVGYSFKPISKQFTLWFFALFIFMVYLNASWWSWQFGCAYGGRAFIEFYPFLAIGLAAFIAYCIKKFNVKFYIFIGIVLLLGIYNLKIIYNFDDCFYGSTWQYSEILNLLFN